MLPTVEQILSLVIKGLGFPPVSQDTPCRNCFHVDVDGITFSIGKPLEREYPSLADFGFAWGVSSHGFRFGDDETRRFFYEKYPKESLRTDQFTVRKFA